MKLTRLFQPGTIGKMEVRNRIIMAAMGTMSCDEQAFISDRTVDYYAARAEGGVGLIITQATFVTEKAHPAFLPGIWDDKFIPSLKVLSDTVHRHGAKIATQIQHPGKVQFKGLSKLDPKQASAIVVGPSAVPWAWNCLAPHEMTPEEIEGLVEAFGEGARRARDAGFDAVEVQAAHGYLISSFLSPFTNRRTDAYGGTPAKRAKFACDILKRIRQKVGADFPVILRISGCDYLKGGATIEQTMQQAPLFVKAGASALHVSGGAQETSEWEYLSYLWPDAAIVDLAEAVKQVVKVPIITVGKISDPVLAERILQEGKADFIAMARGLLADPQLPNKAREGRLDDIVRCIHCNNCTARGGEERHKYGGTLCTVNPANFRERTFGLKAAAKPKKVMVIGGGIGGMEAAGTLAERGHKVSLYEKGAKLGGQWNIAIAEEGKAEYASVIERLTRRLKTGGVAIHLNTEANAQLVKSERPDAVVVATGATPRMPEIPGAGLKHVVQAVDVITGKKKLGEEVVVVGGRLVGMEVALQIAKQEKKVSIVTLHKLGENGRAPDAALYRTLRDALISRGVFIYPDSPLLEIMKDGVYVAHNRELLFLEADNVVMAVGSKAENHLVEELKALAPEVHAIGDCVQPRDGLDAMREGAEVGRLI